MFVFVRFCPFLSVRFCPFSENRVPNGQKRTKRTKIVTSYIQGLRSEEEED